MVNPNSFDKLENIIFDNRHKNLAVFRIGNIILLKLDQMKGAKL